MNKKDRVIRMIQKLTNKKQLDDKGRKNLKHLEKLLKMIKNIELKSKGKVVLEKPIVLKNSSNDKKRK